MEPIKTINIDGEFYDIESMPAEAHAILRDIAVVEKEMDSLKTKLSIAQVAKTSLVIKLKEHEGSFTKVSAPEEAEVESKE